jgi:hypothetical protein
MRNLVLNLRLTAFGICLTFISSVFGQDPSQVPDQIQFDQHVRPILSNHCWSCHGPDEAARKGGLRLDLPDAASAPAESGLTAIVAGQPDSSTLIARIHATDSDSRMPPDATGKPLSEIQKQILRRWISEGAKYESHWAFRKLMQPDPPAPRDPAWSKNEIDQFVLHRLEQEHMSVSPEAAPETWLRRVTLDLTGLPPSLDELQRFHDSLHNSTREDVYSDVVDRLVQSPRHAERMAMHWLDLARYADTNGYNNDETRTMWPWRDWVIAAFAEGMPYDQFLTEQLAGDLLPNASLSQKVATGFNRNHVLTTEGGIIEEEYHVEYVADRVHTTASVFMALSLQCARCHDHKYDPISQREYYQFASFFNNVPDNVVSYSKGRMAEPLLKVPSAAQSAEMDSLNQRNAQIREQQQHREASIEPDLNRWESSVTTEQISSLSSLGLVSHWPLDDNEGDRAANVVDASRSAIITGKLVSTPGKQGGSLTFDGSTFLNAGSVGNFDTTDPFSVSVWVQPRSGEVGAVLSHMDDANAYRGYDLLLENGHVVCHVAHRFPEQGIRVAAKNAVSLNEWHHVVQTWDGSGRSGGIRIYTDGQLQPLDVTTDNPITESINTDKPFHIGKRQTSLPFRGLIDDVRLYATELTPDDAGRLFRGEPASPLQPLLSIAAEQRTPRQQQLLRSWFRDHADPQTRSLRSEFDTVARRYAVIEADIPMTMVMAEPDQPRPCFVLKRGQYDQPAEQVQPAFLRALNGTPANVPGDSPQQLNRLDLARWLTSPEHPLTARVAVNRWWEMLFGIGLVETTEDFGVQGALPSHPELLDWLAAELIRNGWNQRALLKQIVLSATYRQSSHVSPEQLECDPRNRLLARGPRFRLPAETIRDNALFVSGLLKEQQGGPSVKPYQPEGLWEDVSVERREKYVPDPGDGLYRRSMYTFWKRTCPPPGMSTFDAPDRETCVIRRARTNTPLQALVLLNDPTYIEASRILAEVILRESGSDDEKLVTAFRRVLSRDPHSAELQMLSQLIADARTQFMASPSAAEDLLKIGASPRDQTSSSTEAAAWTTAMSILLNLDETISKP